MQKQTQSETSVEKQAMHRKSRNIEFLEVDNLLKQMGISKSQIPVYILKELLDNGIDADEDNNIEPKINVWFDIKDKTLKLSVENQTPFPENEIDNILDLDNYYGTKTYRKYLKRGAQGNALKTIIGFASTQNKTIKLQTKNKIHELGFYVNGLDAEKIHNITETDNEVIGTKIYLEIIFDYLEEDEFTEFMDDYVLSNQNVEFNFDVSGTNVRYDKIDNLNRYNKKDNIKFYKLEDFNKLILAEQDLSKRTNQKLSIINFCKRFDSLSSNRITTQLLKNIDVKWINELTENDSETLYNNMKQLSKEFKTKNLGEVGKEAFKKRVERLHGIELSEHNIKYKKVFAEDNGIPFVIEGFSVFHESIDQNKNSFYINNTPTYDLPVLENISELNGNDINYYSMNLSEALSYYNLSYDSPVHSIFHVYCPNVTFRDYGKSDFVIGDSKNFGEKIKKVFDTLFLAYYKESKRKRKDSELMRKYAEQERRARELTEQERLNEEKYPPRQSEDDYEFEVLFNASEGELRYWFKSDREDQMCNKNALIRAVLISYSKYCRKQELEPVVLRTRVWYRAVKPILLRAEPMAIENTNVKVNWSGVTSNILSDLVQEGKVSYDDYQVFDNSREKRLSSSVYDEIILFVEKNGAYPIVERLAEVYDIKLFAGGGYSGTLAVHELVKYIKRNETNKKKFVILMGDYDPHGFRICNNFIETIGWMGLNVDYERVGINPKHLSKNELETSKYLIKKDKNMTHEEYKNWCDNHGIKGENDKYYGLEIEAVTEPDKLRKIIVDKLIQLCEPKLMYKKIMKNQIEGLPHSITESLLRELDTLLTKIGDDIIEKDKNFDKRKLPKDDLLSDTAIKGESLHISNCENSKKLKNLVLKELKKYNVDIGNLTKQLKNRKK